MDASRHLNNGVTGRYFEEARAELNIHAFGTGQMTDPKQSRQLLFASVTTDFPASASYPGSVEVSTEVVRVGVSS